jgi:hypothetical protein
MPKLSDFGEELIAGALTGTWVHAQVRFAEPHEGAEFPHWHQREIERYHGQVVECECGFWLPPNRNCPACGAFVRRGIIR